MGIVGEVLLKSLVRGDLGFEALPHRGFGLGGIRREPGDREIKGGYLRPVSVQGKRFRNEKGQQDWKTFRDHEAGGLMETKTGQWSLASLQYGGRAMPERAESMSSSSLLLTRM